MNALQITKFYHKEHKGFSQRAHFSFCKLCVSIASFAFKNLLKTFPLVILFGCGEPLMDYETNVTMPVVESYLQQGSNTMTVNVYTMEEFLKDEYKLQKPLSKLKVFVNQIELKETSSGSYSLTLDNDSLREGQKYTLQFMYNGKNIEATTTIPSPIRSLAVEPESVKISSTSFWNISDETQVIVSWDDPDNSFYQIYIISPNNPDMPSMGVFRNRMMQPFQGNTYRLSTRELRSTGIHVIYVYRVSKDYAELYERVSASDLANPVSYIQNAFGIFTSLSVARINVRVTEN